MRRGIAQLCIEEGKQRDDEGQQQPDQSDHTQSQQSQTDPQPIQSASSTSSPPVSFDAFPSSASIASTYPASDPHPSAGHPPSVDFYTPPDILRIDPSPPLPEPPRVLQSQEPIYLQTHPHLHPNGHRPQQTFARPSASFQSPQQDVPLAPTPLETTPITSPRVWTGMEDVTMTGEGGSDQLPAVDLAGLADMFAPGQEWGSLSGFLDSLDFPLSASNQPSPAGGGNNPFSPFNLHQFSAPSPRFPQSNPTTPGGGPNPQFLNSFQVPGGGHDQRQLLAALLDAYKHRLPANIAQPHLPQNGSAEPSMFPPPQPPLTSSLPGNQSQQQPHQQYQHRPSFSLQPPPPSNVSAPPAPSSTASGLDLSPYLQNNQQLGQVPPQSTAFTQQSARTSNAVLPPATERSFAEILQAKYESSELATAEEGWDWERGWAKLDDWMGEK